ncbi:Chromosome (plasmid) partitioning protein ParA [hydrothermal vent metagenome]|uniref:Chromosome (Plasmid) partitioning protein ParA n=1 Tax=hydrothermal vent metagenome TaxID=652676 RepID=A0A3B0W2E9_9ZZZZ
MGRVIAIANQKGGVGKTTTSVNLAAALGRLGKKILLIDLDPQGNATVSVGVDKDQLNASIFEVLVGEVKAKAAIIHVESACLDLLPANGDLTAAEVTLLEEDMGPKRLRKALKKVRAQYDAVVIDCPPTLNMLTLNALTAADGIIVPVQCEYFALEGLSALMGTVDTIQDQLNPSLHIDGLLRTMHDRRNNLANDVSNELVKHFGVKVLQTIIPRNVRLAEAPSHGESVIDYDPASNGAIAYLALAKEWVRKSKI